MFRVPGTTIIGLDLSHSSRYSRGSRNEMLRELNLLATSIENIPGPNARSVDEWLALAIKYLEKAERDMNAAGSDLKSAFVNYTRGGIIIEEVIPENEQYGMSGEEYWTLKDRANAALGEAGKIWELIEYREKDGPWHSVPFIRGSVEIADQKFVVLLPTDLTYRTMVEEIRLSLLRRGLDVEQVTADTPFYIKGQQCLIAGDEDFMGAYAEFKKSLGLRQPHKVPAYFPAPGPVSRDVWILARPTSHAMSVPYIAESSRGKFAFCHWGILVTDVSLKAFAEKISSPPSFSRDYILLGDLYELFRERKNNELSVTSPFSVRDLAREWPIVSFRFVGTTFKSSRLIEEDGIPVWTTFLTQIAASIIRMHPTYHVYFNNCQNFAKLLVEAICGTPLSTKTIEEMVKSLMTPSGRQRQAYLPGAYPQSSSASDYMTAFTTSLHTAEESIFWTANEGRTNSSTYDADIPRTPPPLVENGVHEQAEVEIEWSSW